MAQDFSKLSPEQLSKLANTISEARDLTEFQAEIIDKVIQGEADIGKLRIGYLTEYFDIYSRSLDDLARRHSVLHDAFLVLNNQANKMRHEFQSAEQDRPQSPKKDKKENQQNSNAGNRDNADEADPKAAAEQNENTNASKRDRKAKKVKPAITDKTLDTVDLGPSEEEIKQAVEQRKAAIQALSTFTEDLALNDEERENKLQKNKKARAQELVKFRIHQYEILAQKQREIEDSMEELNALRHNSERDRADRIAEVRLTRLQEITKAEIDAQKLINSFSAEITYADSEAIAYGKNGDEINEAGALRANESDAKAQAALIEEMEEKAAKYRAKRELELKRKNNGILSKEDATRLEKEVAKKFKLDKDNIKKLAAEREKQEAGKALREELKGNMDTLKSGSFEERKEAFKNLTHDEKGDFDLGKTMSAAVLAVSDLAKQLEAKIDEVGGHKGLVDTRLQGSSNKTYAGSYWDQLTRDMMSVGAVTPYFKQEKFAANIDSLVERGIAFDLKQRAFLMTIQEKIANTFNVADGTLLRLIRIQQEDSTAGRLGMESALNSFLNEMYETSEYLTDVAASVRSSLEEMESLASGKEATEIEFEVQKWMGSLYSVGMSQAAVQSIAQALGQIGAGQIEGITNGGTGNLLIMAANDAGLSIAELLIDGIDASDTNKLLQATVNYLAEIAKSSENNRVVQQQLADVFGVKASDLRAATNLVSKDTISNIYSNNMSYDTMISQLYSMAGSMINRTSVAEIMTNLWENGQYTLASSMASNPVSYFIYKMAKVVDDAAGGIDLPFLNVMGFGVDLNTTVSDLMRVAAVGTGILGSIGPMISGLASSFSGRSMLQKMGIESGASLTVTPRGGASGGNIGAAGGTTSESGFIAGNASGSDIKDSTIQEANDSKKQQMIEAKEEEEANQVDVLNETVIKIYELLDDVAHGSSTLKVKVEGYGLTSTVSRANGAMAGLDGIANAGSYSNSGVIGGGGSSASSNGGNSLAGTGVGGSIDLGGWMLV